MKPAGHSCSAALLAVFGWCLANSQSSNAISLESHEPERTVLVSQLPEIARVQEPGLPAFVLRGQIPEQRARELVGVARAVLQDLKRRFSSGKDRSVLPPVDVCLLETTRAYRTFVDGVFGKDNGQDDLGAYSSYRRLVIGNLSCPIGYLRHELVHAFVSDEFGPLPAWLDEGLAALYLAVKADQRGLRFEIDHRLQQIQALRKTGKLPDLKGLASSSEREVYGANFRAYYGLGRYLLLYLDQKGKLVEFLNEYRAGGISADRQLEILTKFINYQALLAWIDKLGTKPAGSQAQ